MGRGLDFREGVPVWMIFFTMVMGMAGMGVIMSPDMYETISFGIVFIFVATLGFVLARRDGKKFRYEKVEKGPLDE